MLTATLEQVNNEIKLCDARILLTLRRINELVVEDFTISEISEEEYFDKEGFTGSKINRKKVNNENQILKLQEGLTRIQLVKQKALELKAKLESSDLEDGDVDNLAALSKVIEQSKHFLKIRNKHTVDKTLEIDEKENGE